MSQKPKILIFSLAYVPFVGGAELAVKEITDRLSGYDFDIITYRFDSRWAKKEKIGNATVHRVGWGRRGGSYYGRTFEKFLFMPLAFFRGLSLHRKNRYSLFWSLMAARAAAPALGMKLLYPRVPFFLTIQEGDAPDYAHRRAGILRPLWQMIFKAADSIQCISEYLKAWVIEEGAEPKRVVVIPNGVDIDKFQVPNSKFQVRNKIITTSRLVQKNGVDTLIDALAEVKKSIPDISLGIVGEGPEREALELRTKNLELEDAVQFLGDIPNEKIPEYLHRADVFARPSRSEGLGTAFLEAMAAGIPIIGTPVGGIPDFLQDGITGLFAKPEDPHDLAQKIIKLLTDKPLAEKISRAGRELIHRDYDWNGVVRKFSAMFDHLIECAQRQKILLVTGIFPPDIGGSATYSNAVFHELSRRGADVFLLTYGECHQSDDAKSIVRVSRTWPKGIRHGIFFLACLWYAGGRNVVLSADASMGGGLPACLAAKILRKRFIVRVTGEYAWEQGQARFGVTDSLDEFQTKKYHPVVEILRFLEHWLVKHADGVIVPSEYLKHIVVGWGVVSAHVYMIYNACSPHFDTLMYRSDATAAIKLLEKKEARAKLGLAENIRLFISVGRLVPWKGFDGLLEAFAKVRENIPNAALYIIGDGPEKQSLEQRAKSLELEKSVVFTGKLSQEKLAVYLHAADVFVLHTAYEGFSHQLIEALILGVPVITTNVGGNPEIITDGENGILVPYNDISKLRAAMENTPVHLKIREWLNQNKNELLKRFNQDRMISELIEIL